MFRFPQLQLTYGIFGYSFVILWAKAEYLIRIALKSWFRDCIVTTFQLRLSF